ncbi:hypothetical protein Ahy_A09g044229 [Arachis hypogaea]|uniref:Plasma membrane ATPase n=1 Tax=Arachis hypogaea TaxID=3818 RepID=A0A445BJQ6_ARAHY|nr:hypothetical protein Ahy_A09g044229 [Arachis hypogaea]
MVYQHKGSSRGRRMLGASDGHIWIGRRKLLFPLIIINSNDSRVTTARWKRVSLAFPPPPVSSHHSSLFYATTIDAAMPTIVGMAPKNQDAIDAAIVGMLADPKEARARIRDVHFLPFNPVDKRTSLTYIDADGNWYRASKGAPEQIMNLCNLRDDAKKKVHAIIDKFAERGLRSLAISRQFLLGQDKDASIATLLVEELIEKADGFAGVFSDTAEEKRRRRKQKRMSSYYAAQVIFIYTDMNNENVGRA